MRASPPVIVVKKGPPTPDFADLSKPAKERIALAARRCFMAYGIYVPLREIAEMAESNEATAIKYYESHDGLVHSYVQELIKQHERDWKRIEAEHPKDPEAQLRSWIEDIRYRTGEAFDEASMLARATAQLYRWDSTPILKLARSYRIRELNRIIQLCRKAEFDEPSSLAHKLVLLVDGARSDSNSFGYNGPHSHLCEAAADLMAAHRGGEKLKSPLD